MLTVTNLAPGKYDVLAGGWPLGVFDAGVLKMVTDTRYEIAYAPVHERLFMKEHPELQQLQSGAKTLNEQIQTYQRQLAKPVNVHFLIRPAQPKKEKQK